jgi:H+-transporting ATPase
MVPIGWTWALVIWGYALVWFFVNDRIKLAAYRIIDPHRSLLAVKRRV